MTSREFHIVLLAIFLIAAGVMTHQLLNSGTKPSSFQLELPDPGEISDLTSGNRVFEADKLSGSPTVYDGENKVKRAIHPLCFNEDMSEKEFGSTPKIEGGNESKENQDPQFTRTENEEAVEEKDPRNNRTTGSLLTPLIEMLESNVTVSRAVALQKLETVDKREQTGIDSRIDVLTGQKELTRSQVMIHQISRENIAEVRSEPFANYIEITQTGDRQNVVHVMQSASENVAEVIQNGFRNRLGSIETGWINPGIASEQISGSKLLLSQNGDYNHADVIQDVSILEANQFGIENTFISNQSYSMTKIDQNGAYNTAQIEQYNSRSEVRQSGNHNQITLRQL